MMETQQLAQTPYSSNLSLVLFELYILNQLQIDKLVIIMCQFNK